MNEWRDKKIIINITILLFSLHYGVKKLRISIAHIAYWSYEVIIPHKIIYWHSKVYWDCKWEEPLQKESYKNSFYIRCKLRFIFFRLIPLFACWWLQNGIYIHTCISDKICFCNIFLRIGAFFTNSLFHIILLWLW